MSRGHRAAPPGPPGKQSAPDGEPSGADRVRL